MTDIEKPLTDRSESFSSDKHDDRRDSKRIQVLWLTDKKNNDLTRVFLISHEDSMPQKVVFGVVADISRTGVRILIRQNDFIQSDKFHVVINPPQELELPSLELKGTKRWDDETQKNIYTAVGVRFDDNQDMDALNKLAESIESRESEENIVRCEIVFDTD